MVVLHVRIFTHRRAVNKDHAFLINSMPGGVSERLDELKVDENTTFRRLRRMIELNEDRGMMRRTPLFQELLFIMINSSNPHNYGKDIRYRYRLGIMNEDRGSDIPKLVSMDHEQSDMPVLDHYRNTARLDLVLVPATQISPSGVCTPHPDPEPPRSQATSGQQLVTAFDAP